MQRRFQQTTFRILLAAGLAIMVNAGAQASGKAPKCAAIMDMCMKRAGNLHAGICEDFYSQAKNTGIWPETKDENGKVYKAFACVRD